MTAIYLLAKRLLWPGPDFSTRSRYGLRNRLLAGPEITTLDIGCGNGCLTVAAALRGKYALGISLEPDANARAERYCAHMGIGKERCEFRVMSVYDIGRADLPKFDSIILFEVLEHLYHDELAISLCARQLKADGWLHITVPNRDNHRHFEGIARTENGRHVRHGYDYSSLEALLRRHGLEPVDRDGIGGLGTVWGFLAVAKAGKLAGLSGRIASALTFLLVWPAVKMLDLLPAKPLSLYVLAVRRDQIPTDRELRAAD